MENIKLFKGKIPAKIFLWGVGIISFVIWIFIDSIFLKILSLILAGIFIKKLYIQYVYCLKAFEEAIKILKENPTNYSGAKGVFGNKKFKYHLCPFSADPDPLIDLLNVLTIHYGDKVLQDKKKSVEMLEELSGKSYYKKNYWESHYIFKEYYYYIFETKKSDAAVEGAMKNIVKKIWNDEALWQIKYSFNESQLIELQTTLISNNTEKKTD